MGIREDTYVALPSSAGGEDPNKSLAMMLKAQYLSREFNDVFAATELREHEIIGISGAMSCRFISLILSTTDEDVKAAPDKAKLLLKERLAIRDRILEDPNAMVFAIEDSYLYSFGLCRQSLNRQSRVEGVAVSSSSAQRAGEAMKNVGMGQGILSKLGLGSYDVAYIPKSGEKKP